MQKHYQINSLSDSILTLPDGFVIYSSIKLKLDSTLSLTKDQDYTLIDSSEHPYIILPSSLRSLLYANTLQGNTGHSSHYITLDYQIFPTSLQRRYSYFKNDSNEHHSDNPTIVEQQHNSIQSKETPSDLKFTKVGGITRGIQVGTTQDATFTNSFNLTFAGTLGEDFSFNGALSEESTPLQPEGNTQNLRDIDRIFVQLNARKYFSATIGDYVLGLGHIRLDSIQTPSLYDNINRKVLGASTTFQVGPTALLTSYSVTKGQFNSLSLQGIDGVQGPYKLTGKNGEQAVIIIAGSEHVYIDGAQLIRGEQNDYVIDYGLTEIRFTAKRIITSASRITVDYEYNDEQYSRNLLAVKQSSSFISNVVLFSTTYLREGDDQNNPRDLSLNDSDKTILAQAGNDASKARKNAVTIVGRDSTGKARGYYVAIDTLSNSLPVRVYRYAPLDTLNAIYTINFGFAGTNKGQYIRKSIGEFAFVGFGNGDYDTLIYLPLPQLHQSLSAKILLVPFDGLLISTEGAISNLQANRFSSSSTIDGKAYTINASFNDTANVFPTEKLAFSISALRKFTSADFAPFDRIRSVESMRQYGLENNSIGTAMLLNDEQENLLTSNIKLSIGNAGITYGDYQLSDNLFRSTHLQYRIGIDGSNSIAPNISAKYDLTSVKDSVSLINSDWHSISLDLHKPITTESIHYIPALLLKYEDRKSQPFFSLSDSLSQQSFRYFEATLSLSLNVSKALSLTTSYQYRNEDSARNGSFTPISYSSQIQIGTAIRLSNGFSGNFYVGYHKRTFTDSLSKHNAGGDNNSLLLHFAPRYRSTNNVLSIEADYQTSELRSASLQRLFFAVQPGQGNYTYLGDLNNNGKQDPEEFQISRYSDKGTYILITIPTDQLTPTVNLHSSLRFRFDPSLDSGILHFFSPLSFETYLRTEANSTDLNTSNIYFLRLSHLLNDSMTLTALREYQQDIYLFEHNYYQSYRIRWLERTSVAQYNTGLEHIYHREVALRARLTPITELTTEQTISYIQHLASSSEQSSTRPEDSKQYKFQSIISYIPLDFRLSFGLTFSVASISDPLYLTSQNALTNTLLFSTRYSLSSQLSLKAEIGRNEFTAHTINDALLPYGLSDGLLPGITWQWSLGADQEITRGVLLNLKYEGRSEPGSSVSERQITHVARAEVRASF